MSELGTFATELIWCLECENAVAAVLSKYVPWDSQCIDGFTIHGSSVGSRRTMFCGELRAGYAGEEIHAFEGEINTELQDVICHPLRLVVMAQNGDNMLFSLLPIAALVTQEHAIHLPEKDVVLYDDKIANPVLSLAALLDHDKENRVMGDALAEGERCAMSDETVAYMPKELGSAVGYMPKDLGITEVKEALARIPDVVVYGDGDTFVLLCKASSESQGWMKSTKVCNVHDGCVVQVTTQQRNPDGSYAVAEAVTYVPDCWIDIRTEPRRLRSIREMRDGY